MNIEVKASTMFFIAALVMFVVSVMILAAGVMAWNDHLVALAAVCGIPSFVFAVIGGFRADVERYRR